MQSPTIVCDLHHSSFHFRKEEWLMPYGQQLGGLNLQGLTLLNTEIRFLAGQENLKSLGPDRGLSL